MKTKKIISITILCSVLIALVVGSIASIGVPIEGVFSSLLTAGGVGAFAFALPVGGTVTTVEGNESGINMTDVSKKVTKIRPDDVPLDTLLREIGAGDLAEALKIEFYQSTVRDNKLVVTTAVAEGADFGAVDVVIDNVQSVLLDDVIACSTVVGADGLPLSLHVIKRNISAKSVTVIAVNGAEDPSDPQQTKVPAIPESEVMYVIGNAKDELAASTDPYQMLPSKDYNYVQTQMSQVSESVYQEMSKKEVDYGLVEFKDDAIYDFRMKADMTAMFGPRALRLDPETGKLKYFSGGVNTFLGIRLQYIIDSTDDTTGLTGKRLISIGETLFSDVNGSSFRIWLAGSTAMTQLMKNVEYSKQVREKETKIIWGIEFNVIETGFGRVYLKHHKGMNRCGHRADIMSIDPTKIRARDWMKMKWRGLELLKPGTKRSNDWVLEEARTLEVRNPNCHGLIVGKVS